MMRSRKANPSVAALALLVACAAPAGGGPADSGPADAGLSDSGMTDAGFADSGPDAGIPDSGLDASVPFDAGAVIGLAMTLARDATPGGTSIVVTVSAGIAGVEIGVAAGQAAVSSVADNGDGTYTATVTPPWPSGELPITATFDAGATSLSASATALVLPTVADGWDQPESVPGLVNTAGYEDGADVSADGEWLIVSSYSPVDLLCCYLGCNGLDGGDPFSPSCQDSLGPSGPPARPDFPGADRILSPTRILNACPKLCFDVDGGEITSIPLSPVAAYGFHRQPDDSFAEPFAIYVDGDGCMAPFGFDLLPGDGGAQAQALAAFNDGENRIDWLPLTLGVPNLLASYSCVDGVSQVSGFVPTELALSPADVNHGNPGLGGGYLWFDDEYDAPPPYLAVATPSGPLPNASFTPSQRVPLAADTDDRRQPFFDQGRLYIYLNGSVASAALLGDPTLAASWSDLRTELGTQTTDLAAGSVLALGEPSVAHRPDSGAELYFVYAVVLDGGINFNVGRVRSR